MDSSPKRPAYFIEDLPGRGGKSTLAPDEIMLLSPYSSRKAPRSQSPPAVPSGDMSETNEAGPVMSKRETFWKAWDSYRHRPWNMCLLVVVGTVFAIGHHLFYLNLDGKEAANQSLMLRYGTVLAFCAKASLGTAVAMAFYQRAWQVVRYKMARLETVDSIFTANSDIFSLLTWSSIKKAKITTLLALYCWLTPLVVVLTSETLSAVARVKEEDALYPSARTLNFENEETVYWRDPLKIDGQYESSVSLWNSTVSIGEKLENSTSTKFDYYTSPSQQYDNLLSRLILTGEVAARKEWAAEVCADEWNCSYVVDFVAPGYKCQELASGVNSKVKKLGDITAPFDTNDIAPMGNLTYYAVADQGDYGDLQMESERAGRPKAKPPYPDNFAAFRTEPILWIGYATVDNYSIEQPAKPREGNWYKAYTPVIIGCEHYEVNYTVQFKFVRGEQSHEVKQREYLRRVINTTYVPRRRDTDKRLKDRTLAVPETNYVFPLDVRKYRRTAAYHTMGSGLRRYLNGTIALPNYNLNSLIWRTHLVDRMNYLPIKNLGQSIQKLYEDMLISFFADPTFSVVSWAANGKPSGNVKGGPSTAYPCRRQRITTFFKYNMTQLLIVYATSIFLAAIGVLLGLQAYQEEGAMRDMKPSSIIEASRASNLRGLGQGKDVRIGYGLVQEEAGRSVRSFGVEGNVHQERRASGV